MTRNSHHEEHPAATNSPGEARGNCDLRYLLTAYLFDNISEAGRREVESELERNPDCRQQLDELRATLLLVEDALGLDGDAANSDRVYRFEERRVQRVLEASTQRAKILRFPPVFRSPWRELALTACVLIGLTLMVAYTQLGTQLHKSAVKDAVDFLETSSSSDTAAKAGDALAYRAPASKALSPASRESTDFDRNEAKGLRRLPASSKPGDSSVVADLDELADLAGGMSSGEKRPGKKSAPQPTPKPEATAVGDAIVESFEGKARHRVSKRTSTDLFAMGKPFTGGATGVADTPAGFDGKEDTEISRSGGERRYGLRDRTQRLDDLARADDNTPTHWQDESVPEPLRGGQPTLPPLLEAPLEKAGEESEEEFDGELPAADPSGPAREQAHNRAKEAEQEVGRSSTWAVQLADGKQEIGELQKTRASTELALGKRVLELAEQVDNLKTQPGQPASGESTPERDGYVDYFADHSQARWLEIVSNDETLQNATDVPSYQFGVSSDYRWDFGPDIGDEVPMEIHLSPEDRIDAPHASTGWYYAKVRQAQASFSSLARVEHNLRAFQFYEALDPTLRATAFFERPLSIPEPPVGDEHLGRDVFRERYGVNPFLSTRRDRFSTFGMDVDTAAWTRTGESLREGALPPAETVRVEEFVNSFPDARNGNPDSVFSVWSNGGPSPFGRGLELLQITVKSRELRPDERKNVVLTISVDTSGSMALDGRMERLRSALRTLVDALQPDDRLALVAFSNRAFVVLPPTAVRDGDRVRAAIESLTPNGGTNVQGGLELAYRLARESFDPRAANRIIVCSDGVATLGSQNADRLMETVTAHRQEGIRLTTLGFGSGDRRAVVGDRMLQELANRGDGNYRYVDTAATAHRIFVEDLPATLQVLAQDAKIQVEFDPQVVRHYRLLGYEKRDIADRDFRNDKVDAGEVGPGTTVTVLYEIDRCRPVGDLGRIFLRYRDTGTLQIEEVSFDLKPGVLATSLASTTPRFRFLAAIAEFAELLRSSLFARDGSYASVGALLATVPPATVGVEQWREVVDLVHRAQQLTVADISQQIAKTQVDDISHQDTPAGAAAHRGGEQIRATEK